MPFGFPPETAFTFTGIPKRLAALDRGEHVDPVSVHKRLQHKSTERKRRSA